jgi:hypothetical protein
MNCERPGYPKYSWQASMYQNPYSSMSFYGDTRDVVQTCMDSWYISFNQWLSTAPITSGSTMPESVTAHTVTAETGTRVALYSGQTLAGYTTVEETMMVILYGEGTPLTTRTIYDVDADGVQYAAETVTQGHSVYTQVDPVYSSVPVSWTTFTNSPTTDIYWTYPAFAQAYYVSDFSYSASAPCCGNCSWVGDDVQVFYWPSVTAAPEAASSILVDSSNFTL